LSRQWVTDFSLLWHHYDCHIKTRNSQMYSKVSWISCSETHSAKLLAHYDSVITPAINASKKHVGQQLVEIGIDKWLLISHYVSAESFKKAEPMVAELFDSMPQTVDLKTESVARVTR
jgi:hypothetical protein